VDIASILVAYRIGLAQLGPIAGMGYGVFDAWVVVWQRRRIAAALHAAVSRLRTVQYFRRKDALPWAAD
jgi:hypothetical protein